MVPIETCRTSREVFEGWRHANPEGGIADKDIELAEVIDRLLTAAKQKSRSLSISGYGDAGATFFFYQFFCVFSVLLIAEVNNGNIGTFASKEDSHCATDATITAGDDVATMSFNLSDPL